MNNTINVPIKINDDTIDDILCTALEGGITYWCYKINVENGDYKGKDWAHEVVSSGGSLILHTEDDPYLVKLNLDTFIKGCQKYADHKHN